jgi:glutamate dehydrogenase/leucine dehydrogenase
MDEVGAGIAWANNTKLECWNHELVRQWLARDQEAIKDTCESHEYTSYQYCNTISFEVCCDRLAAYSQATGNHALDKFVCAS